MKNGKAFQKEIDKTGYDEPNALGAVACEAAYRGGQEWLDQLRAYLLENLNFLRKYLTGEDSADPSGGAGGYLSGMAGLQQTGNLRQRAGSVHRRKSRTLAGWRSNVRSQRSRLQRVNIACPRATLELALDKLKAAVDSLK